MSKKILKKIYSYATRSLKFVEKDIVKNYKTALNDIRTQLMKLDEKSVMTQAEIMKYGRLKSLQDSIVTNMKDIANKNYPLIEKSRKDNFKNAYKTSIGEIDIELAKVNPEFVKASLSNPLWNVNYKKDLVETTRKASRKISNEITQGLIKGDSISKIANRIKDHINGDAKKAITIARTETLRAMSEGQLEATNKLEDKGFKVKKIWDYSYHIKGSRIEHEELNGKEADEDGLFRYIEIATGKEIAIPAPRMSDEASVVINCRCAYYNETVE